MQLALDHRGVLCKLNKILACLHLGGSILIQCLLWAYLEVRKYEVSLMDIWNAIFNSLGPFRCIKNSRLAKNFAEIGAG